MIPLYWLVAAALFVAVALRVYWVAPVSPKVDADVAAVVPVHFSANWGTPFALDPNDGSPIVFQKILYFHLPVAINTFLACVVCFVGGIGYLMQRRAWWDDLAAAGAKVAVVLCTGCCSRACCGRRGRGDCGGPGAARG